MSMPTDRDTLIKGIVFQLDVAPKWLLLEIYRLVGANMNSPMTKAQS